MLRLPLKRDLTVRRHLKKLDKSVRSTAPCWGLDSSQYVNNNQSLQALVGCVSFTYDTFLHHNLGQFW